MQIVLKLLSDSTAGRQVVLPSDDCILGRGDDCGVQLNSQHVSRHHCQIKFEDGDVWVRDLESRNGTYVNRKRLSEQLRLESGDILEVGNFKFELQLVASAADSPQASWSEFCRAVNEVEVPQASGTRTSTLKTVEIPAPPREKTTDRGVTRPTPAGAMLPPPQADSRTAAHEALRRYFNGR